MSCFTNIVCILEPAFSGWSQILYSSHLSSSLFSYRHGHAAMSLFILSAYSLLGYCSGSRALCLFSMRYTNLSGLSFSLSLSSL